MLDINLIANRNLNLDNLARHRSKNLVFLGAMLTRSTGKVTLTRLFDLKQD